VGDNRDNELLSLFRSEENRNYAFNQIILDYQERLYWHIRRIVIIHEDADDVLQNTFLRAWTGLDGFREASQLYTWLYRIATNEALSFLKKKKNRFFISTTEIENSLLSSLKEDDYFDGDEIQIKLQKAILSLPDKQRIVFNMKYYNEMKYKEMADILGTSVGALKASYHHAVKKIEKIISQD
jgi:RNA polymerase sigma factor (sigma-70 family)